MTILQRIQNKQMKIIITTLKGLITLDSSESQPVLVREIYFAYAKCYGGKSAISNIYFWPT